MPALQMPGKMTISQSGIAPGKLGNRFAHNVSCQPINQQPARKVTGKKAPGVPGRPFAPHPIGGAKRG
jgi:hypothetical protein